MTSSRLKNVEKYQIFYTMKSVSLSATFHMDRFTRFVTFLKTLKVRMIVKAQVNDLIRVSVSPPPPSAEKSSSPWEEHRQRNEQMPGRRIQMIRKTF